MHGHSRYLGRLDTNELYVLIPYSTPYDRYDPYDGRQEHRHHTVKASGWSVYGTWTEQLVPVNHPYTVWSQPYMVMVASLTPVLRTRFLMIL